MIIGMSSTRNWYKYLLTNLFAILYNNKVSKIYLFIEDDYIDELKLLEKKFNVQFICKNINNIFTKYISEESPNFNTIYTKCSMSRILFPNEIDEEKILYIDVDALVIGDISGIWNLNMDENYVAGVPDSGMRKDGVVYLKFINSNIPYINSGVLLMNLKLIRENKINEKWLNLINTQRFMYPDQDVINSACKDHVLIMPIKYNSSESTELLNSREEIKIMHYTMKKECWVSNHKNGEWWYEYEELYNKFKNDQNCK